MLLFRVLLIRVPTSACQGFHGSKSIWQYKSPFLYNGIFLLARNEPFYCQACSTVKSPSWTSGTRHIWMRWNFLVVFKCEGCRLRKRAAANFIRILNLRILFCFFLVVVSMELYVANNLWDKMCSKWTHSFNLVEMGPLYETVAT